MFVVKRIHAAVSRVSLTQFSLAFVRGFTLTPTFVPPSILERFRSFTVRTELEGCGSNTQSTINIDKIDAGLENRESNEERVPGA